MGAKEITVASWEDFERKIEIEIDAINRQKKEAGMLYISPLLFRGQSDFNWQLKTTLERFVENKSCRQTFTWKDYYLVLKSLLPATDVFTSQDYSLPDFKYDITPVPQGYNFMIYLRHHNFPSPLLDWSTSYYIAAFFAFYSAKKGTDPAIFTFQEHLGDGKGYFVGDTEIHNLGPNVRNSHKRHYLQQCEYTICYQKQENDDLSIKNKIYRPHEEANFSDEQDKLCKYIIPYTERDKVMAKLDAMNINAFTLFGNEEGLASMLAYRTIEKSNH